MTQKQVDRRNENGVGVGGEAVAVAGTAVAVTVGVAVGWAQAVRRRRRETAVSPSQYRANLSIMATILRLHLNNWNRVSLYLRVAGDQR
jgi:hypothetical protein